MSDEPVMVTHPKAGIYLSGVHAGILGTLITLAIAGGFSNLWYLNRQSIVYDEFMRRVESPAAALPGALSRSEWTLERQLITEQLSSQYIELNNRIDTNHALLQDVASDVKELTRRNK